MGLLGAVRMTSDYTTPYPLPLPGPIPTYKPEPWAIPDPEDRTEETVVRLVVMQMALAYPEIVSNWSVS